jgi:hypothetical protein
MRVAYAVVLCENLARGPLLGEIRKLFFKAVGTPSSRRADATANIILLSHFHCVLSYLSSLAVLPVQVERSITLDCFSTMSVIPKNEVPVEKKQLHVPPLSEVVEGTNQLKNHCPVYLFKQRTYIYCKSAVKSIYKKYLFFQE